MSLDNEEESLDIYSHLLQRHQYHYPVDGTHKQWIKPQVMILFASGNVAKCIEIIVTDMMHPIGSGLVVTLLVEESIRDEVVKKIRASLRPMDVRIQRHPNYLKSVNLIDRLNCQTIHIEEFEEEDTKKRYGHRMKGSPIVVLDFPQYYFGDKPTAVMTMSTFRTLSEVVKLYKRERLVFETASVWSAKLAQCFDLVTRIPQASNWTFNCVSSSLWKPTGTPAVVSIERNFHFENHDINGKVRTIAFPIKT